MGITTFVTKWDYLFYTTYHLAKVNVWNMCFYVFIQECILGHLSVIIGELREIHPTILHTLMLLPRGHKSIGAPSGDTLNYAALSIKSP